MIRIGPGPSLRMLEPRLLLGGCSINTIFHGPTNAHNPPFAAASAVIRDWGRGSRKWAQTPCVNPVCACGREEKKAGAHWWTLAFTCVLFSFFFFFCTGRGGEQLAAASHPSHQTPSDAPAATSQGKGREKNNKNNKKIIKKLELSPLVRSTFGASPPAGVERGKEDEAGPG